MSLTSLSYGIKSFGWNRQADRHSERVLSVNTKQTYLNRETIYNIVLSLSTWTNLVKDRPLPVYSIVYGQSVRRGLFDCLSTYIIKPSLTPSKDNPALIWLRIFAGFLPRSMWTTTESPTLTPQPSLIASFASVERPRMVR